MLKKIPTELDLTHQIEKAARKAIQSLYKNHPEKFYYITLTTTEEGHCPVLSAWSEEALEVVLSEEEVYEEVLMDIKWSYADSPYYAYGEEYFEAVEEILEKRERLMDQDEELEFSVRIKAMEKAMKVLEEEGLFGKGDSRLEVVINAEVMPPDYGNTKRALRLNPKEALREWLKEAAEEEL